MARRYARAKASFGCSDGGRRGKDDMKVAGHRFIVNSHDLAAN
jgi:hypothetical protein